MRLSNIRLAAVASVLSPLLTDAKRERGYLSDDDIRAAVIAARASDPSLPRVGSERSLRLLEQYMCEE